MGEGWLIDREGLWVCRFHRDEKAWLRDPRVFDIPRVFRVHRMTHGGWKAPSTLSPLAISRVAFDA